MSIVFLADYLIRFGLAPDRRAFARHVWNIADLIVIATPLIAIRFGSDWTGVLRIVRVFRLGMIARRVWNSRGKTSRRGQVKWMAVVTVGVVFLAGLTVWSAENAHADATIKSGWDALWWAIVTMFTVGYGETYPHTTAGKVSAVVLMVAGIALFTWLTATMASLFLESGKEKQAQAQRLEMMKQISAVSRQLQSLEADRRGAFSASVLGSNDAARIETDYAWKGEADGLHDVQAGDTVAILWQEWTVWAWLGSWGKKAYRLLRSATSREGFWFWTCTGVYAISITQAARAHDGFWAPAGVSLALFSFTLFWRFPVSWAGWAQWGLLLVLALLFGSDDVSGGLLFVLLFLGAGMGVAEFVALTRGRSKASKRGGCDQGSELNSGESAAVDAFE
jgi:voltage-gated potassium channel